jgi:hypothetical protein
MLTSIASVKISTIKWTCSIGKGVKEEIDKILLEAKETVEVQKTDDKCTAFESVKRIKNTKELCKRITQLDYKHRKGELSSSEKFELAYSKTATFFPDRYKNMDFEDIDFASSNQNKSRLIAAKWIQMRTTVYGWCTGTDNRKSQEIHRMFNKCGMPEEVVFMQQSLDYVTRALKLIGICDIRDNRATFNESVITRSKTDTMYTERLLDESCFARNGRDQTKRGTEVKKRIMSKLRRELNSHGYTLESKRIRVDRRRVHEYRIILLPNIERLLPCFVINTDKRTRSGSDIDEDVQFIEPLQKKPKRSRVTMLNSMPVQAKVGMLR